MSRVDKDNKKDDVIFQIIDWDQYHEKDEDDEKVYHVRLFGRTREGSDVCLKVNNFYPHFYVEVPDFWKCTHMEKLIGHLSTVIDEKTKWNPKFGTKFTNSLVNYELISRYKFIGFCNEKKFKFIKLEFKSKDALTIYDQTLRAGLIINGLTNGRKQWFKRYESNLEPMIRLMHMTGIISCGWIKIPGNKLSHLEEYSYCDINIECDWKQIIPINDETIAPFKIAAYDIECISCDENFPQSARKNDKIIQIGMTIYRYGSAEPNEQYILTLKDVDPIEGIDVRCFKTEKGLLKGFVKLINESRPDILSGYNIFGFDDLYVNERAKLLDMEEEMLKIGKLINQPAVFRKKELSSSAMGDNFLYFFDMPGIVRMDLMKVMQRNEKLVSYKLDFVSANFIQEEIKKITISESPYCEINQDNQTKTKKSRKAKEANHKKRSNENLSDDSSNNSSNNSSDDSSDDSSENSDNDSDNDLTNEDEISKLKIKIHCKGYKGLEIGSYVQLMINDSLSPSPLREEKKYKVLSMSTEGELKVLEIVVDKEEYNELLENMAKPKYKCYWTFAKDDIHHTDIRKYYHESKELRTLVAKYCVKDCKLVNILISKMELITNNIGMAKVCYVPLSWIFLRGQGAKTFSLVSKKCREKGYLIPVLTPPKKKDGEEEDEGVLYEGAIVLEPKPGIYFSPVTVLDFNSLYPNSMRQANLSHETWVNDERYLDIPGYKYERIKINVRDDDGNYIVEDDGTMRMETHIFVKPILKRDETGKLIKDDDDMCINEVTGKKTSEYGIIPEILTELLNARKIYKGKKEVEKDPFMKTIWDSLQNAYKITANSLYGLMGAKTSPIFCLPIAACTTAIGRERLLNAKMIVESNFEGAKIVYGDSVTGDTPLIVKYQNQNQNQKEELMIVKIEDLASHINWSHYPEFKPNERDLIQKEKKVLKDEKGIMQDSNQYKVWTSKGWSSIKKVIRHRTQKKIYRVLTAHGHVDVTEDHSLLNTEGEQIKPGECNMNTQLMHGFMNFESIPNDSYDEKIMEYRQAKIFGPNRCKVSGCLNAQNVYYYLKSLGYTVKIDDLIGGIYYLTFVKEYEYSQVANSMHVTENKHTIKKIYFLRHTSTNEFVYDLETEDGTFHAGVGELIVKNTDSIFVSFGIRDEKNNLRTDRGALELSIKRGQEAEGLINKIVPSPQKIEYEKTFYPFILIERKKYVGNKYGTDPNKLLEQASMGIVLKRRDNAPIVKIVVGGIIDNILNSRDPRATLNYTAESIKKVMAGQFTIDKFILSKTLKGKYKDPTKIAHRVLADRMAIRDPGNKPQINDRISYAYKVTEVTEDTLQGDLIETPEFIKKNNLKVDYLFYLTNQIMNPAVQILKLMVKSPESIFEQVIREEEGRRMGRQNINKYSDLVEIEDSPKKDMEIDMNYVKKESKKVVSKSIDKFGDLISLDEKLKKPKKEKRVLKPKEKAKKGSIGKFFSEMKDEDDDENNEEYKIDI